MSIRSALRSVVTATTVAGLSGLLLLGLSGTASAHVTAHVYGEQPSKGGYGAIVFRVPNHSSQAGTVKLDVAVPAEYAISSASTKPVPGWDAEVHTKRLDAPVTDGAGEQVRTVVTGVTWTAEDGTAIGPGTSEYQEFAVTLGRLPSDVDKLVFAATQTYSDGKVVHWDAPAHMGHKAEHPSPVVPLAAPSGHGHGGMATMSDGHRMDGMSAKHGMGGMSGDTTARWLGAAGLVTGALGLGVGIAATIRARRATASAQE